jgi:cytochrome c-type biogenesis protein CcmH/NrfF
MTAMIVRSLPWMLLASAWLGLGAQEHPSTVQEPPPAEAGGDAGSGGQPAKALPPKPLPPVDAAALQECKTAFVEPFLSRWKGTVASASDLKPLQSRLESLLGEVEGWVPSRLKDPAQRRALTLAVEDLLASGLAPQLGAQGGDAASRARSVVSEAAEDRRVARIEALHRGILCWCPSESWTRTLSGCTESCADEQKAMVQRGVDDGLSDAEIIQQMVDDPRGGPRVRAIPETTGTNLLGYILPLILVAGGVFVVVAALFGLSSRRAPPAAPGGGSSAEGDEDRIWGERIEKEIKEMGN